MTGESTIFEMEHNSEEWFRWRSTLLTASKAGKWLTAESKLTLNGDAIKAKLKDLEIPFKSTMRVPELTALLPAEFVAANQGHSKVDARARHSQMCRMLGAELSPTTWITTQGGFTGTKSTDYGHTFEPEAVEEFEMVTGLYVTRNVVAELPSLHVGASPDGVVSADPERSDPFATFEAKCLPLEHVEMVLADVMPPEFEDQVHFQMAVTGFREAHFYGFSPEMKGIHKVVKRDVRTARMVEAIKEFGRQYEEFRHVNLPKLKP